MRARISEAEAKHFDRYSIQNAAQVESALACGCKAYEDVYTYGRWQGLGFQIQRGERAIRLATVRLIEEKDDEGEVTKSWRIPWFAAVFCRHQVKPLNGNGHKPATSLS